jgi:hypothetical protein
MAKAHLYALTLSGKSVPVLADEYGNVNGGGGSGSSGAAANAEAGGWAYVAGTGGVTDTSDVSLAAAPGSLLANYITSIQVINAHASTGTEVVVKSGSTILFRQWAGSGGNGFVATFPRPLVAAENTAMTAACITTGTVTYINAQGFIAALPNVAAQVVSQGEEIVDDYGAYITDAAGATIYNA